MGIYVEQLIECLRRGDRGHHLFVRKEGKDLLERRLSDEKIVYELTSHGDGYLLTTGDKNA